jgi:hypothetical protein
MQIRVRELEDEVDVLPLNNLTRRGQHNVAQVEHVLVRKVLQQPHLTQRALAVVGVVEGILDLLDCHHHILLLVGRRTQTAVQAIRTRTNFLLDLIAVVDLEGLALHLVLLFGHLRASANAFAAASRGSRICGRARARAAQHTSRTFL